MCSEILHFACISASTIDFYMVRDTNVRTTLHHFGPSNGFVDSSQVEIVHFDCKITLSGESKSQQVLLRRACCVMVQVGPVSCHIKPVCRTKITGYFINNFQ